MSKIEMKVQVERVDESGRQRPRWYWKAVTTNGHGETAHGRERGYGRLNDLVHALEWILRCEIEVIKMGPRSWELVSLDRPLVRFEVKA